MRKLIINIKVILEVDVKKIRKFIRIIGEL
jgi:hypothetical protein